MVKTNHLLSLSTIRDVIDVSQVKQQSCLNIFVNFCELFTEQIGISCPSQVCSVINLLFVSLFFPFVTLVMETNSFTWLKLRTAISNVKLKNLSDPFNLYEEFARGVHSHTVICYCGCCTCYFHWCWYKDQRSTNRRPWN